MAEKTYLFRELYIETILRNPKKVGLFGYRWALGVYGLGVWALGVYGFRAWGLESRV